MLAWPGRHLRKFDRKHFKAAANPDGGGCYWINEDMVTLFAPVLRCRPVDQPYATLHAALPPDPSRPGASPRRVR